MVQLICMSTEIVERLASITFLEFTLYIDAL